MKAQNSIEPALFNFQRCSPRLYFLLTMECIRCWVSVCFRNNASDVTETTNNLRNIYEVRIVIDKYWVNCCCKYVAQEILYLDCICTLLNLSSPVQCFLQCTHPLRTVVDKRKCKNGISMCLYKQLYR